MGEGRWVRPLWVSHRVGDRGAVAVLAGGCPLIGLAHAGDRAACAMKTATARPILAIGFPTSNPLH